jgi:leader peptidase (prepilin peptidase)/N-methyltransferase
MLWIATLALLAGLAAAAMIDLRTGRIPDMLTLGLAVAGLIFAAVLQRDMVAACVGMIAGYAALWAVNRLFRATRGHDGLGMGDAKLLGASGAWLGWAPLPFVVLIASALGLAGVGLARLRGRPVTAGDAIRFGPYLAAGIGIAWFAATWPPLQR